MAILRLNKPSRDITQCQGHRRSPTVKSNMNIIGLYFLYIICIYNYFDTRFSMMTHNIMTSWWRHFSQSEFESAVICAYKINLHFLYFGETLFEIFFRSFFGQIFGLVFRFPGNFRASLILCAQNKLKISCPVLS